MAETKTITIDTSSASTGVYSYISIAKPPHKPKVSTCKNCGAPVHNNVCEYCGTEY